MADGTASYPRGYYQEWAARLAFIIVFEHVIFIAVAVIAWLIPDAVSYTHLTLPTKA